MEILDAIFPFDPLRHLKCCLATIEASTVKSTLDQIGKFRKRSGQEGQIRACFLVE